MFRYAFIKLGMTSAFSDSGESQGVTVLRCQPSKVIRHEKLKDGRIVVVVEYDIGTKAKLTKGWPMTDTSGFEVGSIVQAPDIKKGSSVKITGFSKGRGFQDCITRHNFSGGPGAHGSRFHRAPGSVGMRTQPGRTIKGKKLPGQHGNVKKTISNAKVAHWSSDDSLLAVVGGVPGSVGQVVFV